MTKGSAVTKRRSSRSSPTSIVNINREGKKKKTIVVFKSGIKSRHVYHTNHLHHQHALFNLGISPQEVSSNKENNKGGRGGKGGGGGLSKRTPRSRHVFFAPETTTTTGIVTPQPSNFNNKTKLINQFRISPISSSSSSPWCVPSSMAASATPQQDQQQQQQHFQNGMTTSRRKSKSTPSSKSNSNSNSNSHKKSSSSHKRWKQLLFKRLRAKDSRILHFLQSRPPPPTVGPAVHMMDVCANDEEVGSGSTGRGEYDYFGQNHDDNISIPEPYMHFFNQLSGESSRNRSNSSGSSGSNQSDVENDDEEKSMPITTSSHSHTFGNGDNGGNGGNGSSSLDLFGSYLQQDYQQSDYSNSNLFDENMFVTC